LLTQQYEMAKIQEAKDTETIRIVDDAAVPEKKSWPPRAIIISATGVMMCLISAFYIVGRERISQLPSDHTASKVWNAAHLGARKFKFRFTRAHRVNESVPR